MEEKQKGKRRKGEDGRCHGWRVESEPDSRPGLLDSGFRYERGIWTFGSSTRDPTVMPCWRQNPAWTSKTNCAGASEGRGVSEKGAVLAAMLTMIREALMKIISKGSGVFFIQNDCGSSCGKRNSMPEDAGRSRRYMRPKLRLVGVSAISTGTRTGAAFAGYNVTEGRLEEAHADERARRMRKKRGECCLVFVIPGKRSATWNPAPMLWIPACAGMTNLRFCFLERVCILAGACHCERSEAIFA